MITAILTAIVLIGGSIYTLPEDASVVGFEVIGKVPLNTWAMLNDEKKELVVRATAQKYVQEKLPECKKVKVKVIQKDDTLYFFAQCYCWNI